MGEQIIHRTRHANLGLANYQLMQDLREQRWDQQLVIWSIVYSIQRPQKPLLG